MNVFIFKFLFIYSCVGSLLQRMGSLPLLGLTPAVVNEGCSPVVVCGSLLQRVGSSPLLRLTPAVVNEGCSPVVVCGSLLQRVGSLPLLGLTPAVVNGGCSPVVCVGFWLQWLLPLWKALVLGEWAWQLWLTGLVAP